MLTTHQLKQFLRHAISYRHSQPLRGASLRLLAESALSATDLAQILGDPAGINNVERQYLFGLFCLAGRSDAVRVMLNYNSNEVRIAAEVALEKTGNLKKQSLTKEKEFGYMIFDKLFGVPISGAEYNSHESRMEAHIMEALFLEDPADELGLAKLIELTAHSDEGISALSERALRHKGESVADSLIDALPQLPPHSTEVLFSILSEIKDKRLLEYLSHSFDKGNFVLPPHGADAIASFGDDLAVGLLLKLLQNAETTDAKQSTRTAIIRMGHAAVETLKTAYSENSWFRRTQGELFAEAVGTMSLQQLLNGLQDPLRSVRDSAGAGLISLGTKAVHQIQELLDKSEPEIRIRCLRLLGQIADESSSALISKHVTKGSRQERISAIKALGLIWSATALNTLGKALTHSDWRVREAAASAIENASSSESKRAVDLLKMGLVDKVRGVRRASVFALYGLARKNESEFPVIRRIISDLTTDQDTEIATLARDTLSAIQGLKSVASDQSRKSPIADWLDSFFCLHSPEWTPDPVPEPSTGITDDVHFSVTAPSVISPGTAFMIDVWAHIDRWIQYSHRRGGLRDCYNWVVQTVGPVCVSSGAVLRIVLKVPDFGIVEETTMSWFGVISNCNFALEIPKDADLRAYRGAVEIGVGDMQVARVSFLIEVGLEVEKRIEDVTSRETKIDTAFASYSSKDKKDVLAIIQGMLTVLPELDIYLDAKSLRSGEDWKQRIEEEIGTRDIFYLFWSCSASKSTWVEWEWRTAIRMKAMQQIAPVPLESPSKCPPPTELASMHFNDWTLVYRQASP